MSVHKLLFLLSLFTLIIGQSIVLSQSDSSSLILNEKAYFEKQGFNVFVFNNFYDGYFGDNKIGGVEFVHHGIRTVSNGDVRLSPTPGQWDPIPDSVETTIDQKNNTITANCSYVNHDFNYSIQVKSVKNDIIISVVLEEALPKSLEGKAGFNLEFIPSAYFEKSYLMDGKSHIFPLYPTGPTRALKNGDTESLPISSGKKIVLAPEDPNKKIIIEGIDCEFLLYDGRNEAQNGWYVLRSLVPSNKSGTVLQWSIKANTIPDWIREPVILHSQLGYHPNQKKVAVIELDKNDVIDTTALLWKYNEDGSIEEIYSASTNEWGEYLRYNYLTFDFTSVTEKGLYLIEYNSVQSNVFRIEKDIYKSSWYSTLDVYFPVQMDHMMINEAYRVWHGASHLDDALQAPTNHTHFDLYAQGATTDSPYEPREHIPGLNVGGWYDAGDYDIRTQTQYAVVLNLVYAWEQFGITRDETYVNQAHRYVDIHHPDSVPDIIQQIEHGTIALVAQHNSIGHAIPGIIVPTLEQYTHLGDGITMTDNLIYNPELDSLESDGYTSGTFDDRWAFTSRSSALNYGSIAALAAASRALKGYNDELAAECLSIALKTWEEEQNKEPDMFSFGNTTGGMLENEMFKASLELLICTDNEKYKKNLISLLPSVEKRFIFFSSLAVRAIPYMDDNYKKIIREHVVKFKESIKAFGGQNPFEVYIGTGSWAGSGMVVMGGIGYYNMHKAFPDLIDKENVFRSLNYIYGTHPGSSISFVSGVGTVSKKIAYGSNRADFSYIAGGVVPGVLILKPDLPENREDWPFFWGQNEYVIGLAASYIYLVNAVDDLLNN